MTKRSLVQSALLSAIVAGAALDAQATPTVMNGGAVNHVFTVRETYPTVFDSFPFADLPGATVTFSVPSGQAWAVIGTITADTECRSASSQTPSFLACYARMMILKNGVTDREMKPDSYYDFQIGTILTTGGRTGKVASAFTRSYRAVGPATFTVRVQAAVDLGAKLYMGDWHFEVLTAKQ